MSFRFAFKIALIFCLAIFWKPVFLGGVGAAAKVYVYIQKGWQLRYSSIDWNEKGIVFADLSLVDGKSFSLAAGLASASLQTKQIKIEKPHLVLFGTPKWETQTSDWSVVLEEGVLEGEGLERATFSFEKGDISRLVIEWETGSAIVRTTPREEGLSIEIQLNHLNPHCLKRWGEWSLMDGNLNGHLEVLESNGKIIDWKLSHFYGDHLHLQSGHSEIGCEKFHLDGSEYSISEGFFSALLPGGGVVAGESWSGEGNLLEERASMEGRVGTLEAALNLYGTFEAFQADATIEGLVNGAFFLEGGWQGSSLHCKVHGEAELLSSIRLEHLSAEIEMDESGLSFYGARGMVLHGPVALSLYCPVLQTRGNFDIRLEGELRDYMRLTGESREGQISLDRARSHILGEPILYGDCDFDFGVLRRLNLQVNLLMDSLSPFLQIPESVRGNVDLSIAFEKERGVEVKISGTQLNIGDEPIDLLCRFLYREGNWKLESSHINELSLLGSLFWQGGSLYFAEGKGKWKEGFDVDLEGRFDSLHQWSVRLTRMSAELDAIRPVATRYGWLEKVSGTVEGSGTIAWRDAWEMDFDFVTSHLKAGPLILENRTPLHFSYSQEKGVLLHGLDLSVLKFDSEGDYEIGFLPTLSCTIEEGFVPFCGEAYPIQNLHLLWEAQKCTADFNLLVQSKSFDIGLSIYFEPKITGRFSIQNTLFVDWTYDGQFSIQAIEGTFVGLETSFHSEIERQVATGFLIGSARIDFKLLETVIPPRIAEIFRDLEMGDGYELMGRLGVGNDISFKGILSGKQFDLFGFQLRTLLAQVEITPERIHIYDLKISDSGGLMKIDEIEIAGGKSIPWTISIPHLTILELRPSLLQKIGESPGEISPLVVRTLKIDSFQGMLEESKTYTARGELFFINSYKREHTLFDIPSDVLSRIVGIDLDLLIPVCGTLTFHLKDGFFHLTELKDAFSENRRSEFFLVTNETSPRMDLDGNLSILINMKQFVLFKFTEAFLISVEGKLDDPQYHLQKKKRFGL